MMTAFHPSSDSSAVFFPDSREGVWPVSAWRRTVACRHAAQQYSHWLLPWCYSSEDLLMILLPVWSKLPSLRRLLTDIRILLSLILWYRILPPCSCSSMENNATLDNLRFLHHPLTLTILRLIVGSRKISLGPDKLNFIWKWRVGNIWTFQGSYKECYDPDLKI